MKILTIISLIGLLAYIAYGNEFKSLKTDYAAKARFIEHLTEIRLEQVSLDETNLSSALSNICKGDDKNGNIPIVNYVITYPTRQIDADPFSDNPVERAKIDPLVSYHALNVSFTTVLDELCSQAGYVWSIFNGSDGNLFILVEYKNG